LRLAIASLPWQLFGEADMRTDFATIGAAFNKKITANNRVSCLRGFGRLPKLLSLDAGV
jgi:hypothetical protein